MNRVERITMDIENAMSDAEMDGYHTGYDEGYDEAIHKADDLIDEAWNEGFDEARDKAFDEASTVSVSYKGRTSDAYKFTTSDRNDQAIKELKASVSARNKSIRDIFKRYEAREHISKWAPKDYGYGGKPSQPHDTPQHMLLKRVRLMPRGPRAAATVLEGHPYRRAYDSYLPMKYASHYDVYVNRDA